MTGPAWEAGPAWLARWRRADPCARRAVAARPDLVGEGRSNGALHRQRMAAAGWGKVGYRTAGGAIGRVEGGSRPISRVLSWTTIHLGRTSPCASSDLPGSPCGQQERARKLARFPIWSCSRWGLPCRRMLPPARCALTAPFHPYLPAEADIGGLLSVALSVGSRPPGVTWHLALRSPDFPPRRETQRLPGRLPRSVYAACRAIPAASLQRARARRVPCDCGP
jgi:hypothetical protein